MQRAQPSLERKPTMKTPAQIEKSLKAAFSKYENKTHAETIADLEQARTVYRWVRSTHGIKSPGKLLTQSISKLEKNETPTYGLAFLPATYSELGNLCAFSDSCAETCVAFSGNGSFSSTMRSRQAKTHFMINHPYEFIVMLCAELATLHEYTNGESLVRLNTYSDIRWERIFPDFMRALYSVQFYDYTKHTTRSRPAKTLPDNYRLTYSVSEKTTAQEIKNASAANRNLAVVVSIRSGKTNTGWRPIPKTWANMPTVDGDQTDDRANDPTGVVVILRRKHTMKPWHPMIQTASKLNKEATK
jgi:hypothetical protein